MGTLNPTHSLNQMCSMSLPSLNSDRTWWNFDTCSPGFIAMKSGISTCFSVVFQHYLAHSCKVLHMHEARSWRSVHTYDVTAKIMTLLHRLCLKVSFGFVWCDIKLSFRLSALKQQIHEPGVVFFVKTLHFGPFFSKKHVYSAAVSYWTFTSYMVSLFPEVVYCQSFVSFFSYLCRVQH